MAYSFEFDSRNQILRGRFENRVTDKELKAYYQVATQHAARINPQAGITDFSAVTDFDVSHETIRKLAALPPVMPGPCEPRFIVAPMPAIYGMARMFQFEGEATRPNLHVVHTMREVSAILGVQTQRMDFKKLTG